MMTISASLFNKIKSEALKHFRGKHGCHGFDHTERVLKIALHLGRKERADLNIIRLAVILHDIGRYKESETFGRVCHAEEGARLARHILSKRRIDAETIDKIIHCIENHRFRGTKKPVTLEAKILFDADKLDSIGAVGIGRAFLFAGEVGAMLHNNAGTDILKTSSYSSDDTAYREFLYKLQHIHKRMLTKEGRRLAKDRHKFMVIFFKRLCNEVGGCL